MSWTPFYNAWVVCLTLVSSFFWVLGGAFIALAGLFISLVWSLFFVFRVAFNFLSAFGLFLLSEILIFLTLFVTILWCGGEVINISPWLEIPLLGSFFLIGSSITATAFHHSLGLSYGRVCLLVTIFLGTLFMVLQAFELYYCGCDILSTTYHAVCFATVGLHFSHVLIGWIGLVVLLLIGTSRLSRYHVNLVVWYWHFVDYIWLLVYLFVYIV